MLSWSRFVAFLARLLLLTCIVVMGCHESTESALNDSGVGFRNDTGIPSWNDASNDGSGNDVVIDGSNNPDQCSDLRQWGDRKNMDDRCWDPPDRYCSSGAATVVTWTCSKDGTKCCLLNDGCIPCSWNECWVGADCDNTDDPGCKVATPGCPGTVGEMENRVGDWDECRISTEPFCASPMG
jgi:hypothetical protein